MAKRVITATQVSIGGTDYTALVQSAELTLEADVPEKTNMSSAGWREFMAGLKAASFSAELFRDAATNLDSDLWTAFDAGAELAIILKATAAAQSATNPEWQFSIIVSSYSPLSGAVGDAASFTWSPQVTGAVVRDDGS